MFKNFTDKIDQSFQNTLLNCKKFLKSKDGIFTVTILLLIATFNLKIMLLGFTASLLIYSSVTLVTNFINSVIEFVQLISNSLKEFLNLSKARENVKIQAEKVVQLMDQQADQLISEFDQLTNNVQENVINLVKETYEIGETFIQSGNDYAIIIYKNFNEIFKDIINAIHILPKIMSGEFLMKLIQNMTKGRAIANNPYTCNEKKLGENNAISNNKLLSIKQDSGLNFNDESYANKSENSQKIIAKNNTSINKDNYEDLAKKDGGVNKSILKENIEKKEDITLTNTQNTGVFTKILNLAKNVAKDPNILLNKDKNHKILTSNNEIEKYETKKMPSLTNSNLVNYMKTSSIYMNICINMINNYMDLMDESPYRICAKILNPKSTKFTNSTEFCNFKNNNFAKSFTNEERYLDNAYKSMNLFE